MPPTHKNLKYQLYAQLDVTCYFPISSLVLLAVLQMYNDAVKQAQNNYLPGEIVPGLANWHAKDTHERDGKRCGCKRFIICSCTLSMH